MRPMSTGHFVSHVAEVVHAHALVLLLVRELVEERVEHVLRVRHALPLLQLTQ